MVRTLPDISFCTSLYQTPFFYQTNGSGAMWQGWVLSAIALMVACLLYYYLWKRNRLIATGEVERANKMCILVYTRLVRLYMVIMMTDFILNSVCTVVIDIVDSDNKAFVCFVQGIVMILPSIQMAMVIFLFLKNTISVRAYDRSKVFTIIYGLSLYLTRIYMFYGHSLTTAAALKVVIEGLFILVCLYIFFRQCQYYWDRRPIIMRYLLIVMIVIFLDIVNWLCVCFGSNGGCIGVCGAYIWYLVYPGVFMLTVSNDSTFWNDASKPMLTSTQQSLASMDLFSLPGYIDAAINPAEDRKTRFRKLKQIVSGYVRVVPFSKIRLMEAKIPFEELPHVRCKRKRSRQKLSVFKNSEGSFFSDSDTDAGGFYNSSISQSRDRTFESPSSRDLEATESRSEASSGRHMTESAAIGKGATSKVFRGKFGRRDIAVKCLLRLNKDKEMSWSSITLIFRESLLNSSLAHENIVKFLGASLTYDTFYLLYEYCPYGDLQQILVDNCHNDTIPQLHTVQQRLMFLRDIANGMSFLHKHGFVHRDLKTANVVVHWQRKQTRFIGKLCDFGVSRQLPGGDDSATPGGPTENKIDIEEVYNPPPEPPRIKPIAKPSSKQPPQPIQERPVQSAAPTPTPTPGSYRPPKPSNKHLQQPSPVDYKSTGSRPEKDKPHKIDSKKLKPSAYQQTREEKTDIAIEAESIDPNQPINNLYVKEISRTIHVGTPAFLAPEILLKLVRSKGVKLGRKSADPKVYCDFATDVYSYGVCMWSIITCHLPYKDFKPMKMVAMIYNEQRLSVPHETWLEWERCCDSGALKKLLTKCWAQYPQRRPTFAKIVDILSTIDRVGSESSSGSNSDDSGGGNSSGDSANVALSIKSDDSTKGDMARLTENYTDTANTDYQEKP